MSYVRTNVLIAKLDERLKALKVSDANPEALLQRVGVFGANRMVEALRATFASESRLCFIVPGGDTHANSQPDVLLVHSKRNTRFALIIADRVMDTASPAAVIGGANSLGILHLKDEIIESLTTTPLDLPGVALVPGEGEPIVISKEEEADAGTIGREAWLQWFSTYAGETVISIP